LCTVFALQPPHLRCGLRVWEIHSGDGDDSVEWHCAAAASCSATESTPPPASAQAASPGAQEFIVLIQPVTFRIPCGQTTLACGTRLPVVSRDAVMVNVRYLD
jgi:hypothetical protein